MLLSGFSSGYKVSIPSYAVGPELPLSKLLGPFPNTSDGQNLRQYIVLIGGAIGTGHLVPTGVQQLVVGSGRVRLRLRKCRIQITVSGPNYYLVRYILLYAV